MMQVDDLLARRLPLLWSLPDGRLAGEIDERPRGLLAGSFNPLHEGHLGLREAAECRLGGPVWFEMTVQNADKPPLDAVEIERRRRQFTVHPLVLTCAPTFAGKAELLPGIVFVVGVDTAERIVEPGFYGGSREAMNRAFEIIGNAGCRFLVAGRLLGGVLRTLADVEIPRLHRGLFEDLPADEFRFDMSSTELRERNS